MMAAMAIGGRSVSVADLLADLAEVGAAGGVMIGNLQLDSRRVSTGDLFVALQGERCDGNAFIDQAVAAGAAAVIHDADVSYGGSVSRVPVLAVPDLRQRLGIIASRFFAFPAANLRLIGVTGTNGKTSVASFVAACLNRDGRCGLIGTLGQGFPGALHPLVNTTPDPITINRALREFCDHGADAAVMEVSSHGLHQGRVSGLEFHAGVFTNLSHDHLDYHGDMDAYGEAKSLLFTRHRMHNAVINIDDEFGRRLCAEIGREIRLISYGVGDEADALVRARKVVYGVAGVAFDLCTPDGSVHIESSLLGEFSVSNLLAVAAVLYSLDMPLQEAGRRLAELQPVPGRMERFGNGDITAVVDYAHTPDALEKVLRSLRVHCDGRLICVFGCGGDRDKVKRPAMGRIAAELADGVIVTDDNPRGESPAAIVQQIMGGAGRREHVEVIHDRATAIARAIAEARAGDMVLVAGKGHEDYQIIKDQRIEFSDRETVEALLR